MWTPPPEFDEYRLVRPLSGGAMSLVYLAQDTLLERPVAVKFLDEDDREPDAIARERFLVEARAIARLQHPNVVAVYRVGHVDGRSFLVSEYVRGRTLDRIERPVASERLFEIALGLARGLAAAHRHGVLHRDIKPGNAILAEDGQVKLLDFGIAKLLDAPSGDDLGESSPAPVPTVRFSPGEVEQLSDSGKVLDLVHARAQARPGGAAAAQALSQAHPDFGIRTEPEGLEAQTIPLRASPRTLSLTRKGMILGTPLYMAPEVWRGEQATYRADVYALGALVYALATGQPPHVASNIKELRRTVLDNDARPLASVSSGVDPRLAAIVDRCLQRDPAKRFASAEDLRSALEDLIPETGPIIAIPEGNPYRGLSAFHAEHRGLFFGRGSEVRSVIERLRAEPLVVVAGDSGVGKSSLCRAGVLPRVWEGELGPTRRWATADLVPGRWPMAALVAAIAPHVGLDEDVLGAELVADPGHIARILRRRQSDGLGLLVFVDQLEELVTLANAEEATRFAQVLLRLASGTPGLRVLATARGDFLTRLSAVAGLGDELIRACTVLRPLTEAGIREAIVGPARAKGVTFESDALVERLVGATARTDGGLPLLQFALAELWEARDQGGRTIPLAALEAIGGVEGALARHADGVLGTLPPPERLAARRVLLGLVTTEGTRARRGAGELVSTTEDRSALEALVRGRLLVAHEAVDGTEYEVAHEALLDGWATLRGWLAQEPEVRAARERLARAATDWERLGRVPEALWGAAQLAEVQRLDAAELQARERAFLGASRRAVGRARLLRTAVIGALPLVLLAIYFGAMLRARHAVGLEVATQLGVAQAALEEARARAHEAAELRRRAFGRFDSRDAAAEPTWAHALAAEAEAERTYGRAEQAFEAALMLDASQPDVRGRLAEVLYERVLLAELGHRPGQREELMQRMALHDEGGARSRRLAAPAQLKVSSDPPGATVTMQRYSEDERGKRTLGEPTPLGVTPIATHAVAPGSYLLTLTSPGRHAVRVPVRLVRGETLATPVTMPVRVPEGLVYVPAGRFLFGSAVDESVRARFLQTAPLHEVRTEAFLIGRHEVTYREWIAFLEDLSPAERQRRTPRVAKMFTSGALDLVQDRQGWLLNMQPNRRPLRARAGERLVYPGRTDRASVDWLRLPVSGVSAEDAEAYAAWLDRTGRLRGARLCTELEWERAARGADERELPTGDRLDPSDADYDETYGRQPLAMGPDEVGSHPASASPFGVEDLAGNVWEWVHASLGAERFAARGGSFYHTETDCRSTNRQVSEPSMRDLSVGVRICAGATAR